MKRRHRLLKVQVAILEQEFQKGNEWDQVFQAEQAKRLGITRIKVYKWHYDRLRKLRKNGGSI